MFLYTKLGIEKVLGFIETIRFVIRKWYLDKGRKDLLREGSPGDPEAEDVAGSETKNEKGTSDAD
jgi:hypothetical protein